MGIYNRYSVDDIHKLRTDRLALNDAILRFEPLIRSVVRELGFFRPNHYHEGMEYDDAIQAGRVGLWRAILKFDESKAQSANKGDPFVAYASTKIKHEILEEMRRCQWTKGSRNNGHILIRHLGDEDWESQQRWCEANWRGYQRASYPPNEDPDPTLHQAEDREWCEKIDKAVMSFDAKRRNVYEGVMKNDDGSTNSKKGDRFRENLGLSYSRISQYRFDIRKRLWAALH